MKCLKFPEIRFFSSLRFSDPEQEHAFVESRTPCLTRNLRLGIILLMLAVLLGTMHIIYWYLVTGSDRLTVYISVCTNGVTVCISLGMLFYLTKLIRSMNDDGIETTVATLRPQNIERLGVCMAILSIFVAYNLSRPRMSRLFGQVESGDTRSESDSNLLLALDTIVTCVALGVPIRVHILLVVPIAAVSSFVATSIFLGSPESAHSVATNTVLMIILIIMAVAGSHQIEARERDRFVEVSKVRKEMVKERIARFDLEHQLEQSNVFSGRQEHFHSGIGEDTTEVSFELSVSKPSEASSSQNQPTNVVLGRQRYGKGDVSHSESGLHALEKISAPVMQDKSTDPLLIWKPDGWQCQRCQKPPLLPQPSHASKDQLLQDDSKSSSSSPRQDLKVCLTPETTILYHIREVVRFWSLERASTAECCQLHHGLRGMHTRLQKLLDSPCDFAWKPFFAAQCATCFCMLPSMKVHTCEVCGANVWPSLGRPDSSEMFSDPSLASFSSDEVFHSALVPPVRSGQFSKL
eukprot:gnl/MRDRNA2_/MRDRNA2_86345_c1_seq1.p1 gnl/MRDRNA2_/MRDRNA2_86345_c1~~gnl/MRDRNA2_/MRDRNA2_86345_c1_seq1.p1  ORF type:complete len:521 (+),score=31.43 gnl/MRDRNA2_/MRDRNA2_86345_c1_seq1:94-1656(+)